MRYLFYSIVSSFEEYKSVTNALLNVKFNGTIPNSKSCLLIVDNGTGLFNGSIHHLSDLGEDSIRLLSISNTLSLNQVLLQISESICFDYCLRLDPDDFISNLHFLTYNFKVDKFDLLYPHYCLIDNHSQFDLNHTNGMVTHFELLGAGVLISSRLFSHLTKLISDIKGQDNFGLWLLIKLFDYTFDSMPITYNYNVSNLSSMSSQYTRILLEKQLLLRKLMPDFLPGKLLLFGKLCKISSFPSIKLIYDYSRHLIVFGIKFFNHYLLFSFNLTLLISKLKILRVDLILNSDLTNVTPNQLLPSLLTAAMTNSSLCVICKFDKKFR